MVILCEYLEFCSCTLCNSIVSCVVALVFCPGVFPKEMQCARFLCNDTKIGTYYFLSYIDDGKIKDFKWRAKTIVERRYGWYGCRTSHSRTYIHFERIENHYNAINVPSGQPWQFVLNCLPGLFRCLQCYKSRNPISQLRPQSDS